MDRRRDEDKLTADGDCARLTQDFGNEDWGWW